MRSLEWRTSEPKRASLRRRWTSSVSSALLERERDLGGERAQRGAVGGAERLARGDEQDAAQLLARGSRPSASDVRSCAGARCRRAATRASGSSGIAGRRRGAQSASAVAARVAPARALGRRRRAAATIRSAPSSSERRARSSSPARELVGRRHGRRVDLVALGRGHERGAGAAQHALAVEGALLLADEAGHARDDEAEQDDRRADDDDQVDVAAGAISCTISIAGAMSDAHGQQRQAERREARRAARAPARSSSRIDGCSAAAPQSR